MLRKIQKELLEVDKNLNEIEKILTKYDQKVQKQFELINKLKEYCMKSHMTIEEYEKLIRHLEKET